MASKSPKKTPTKRRRIVASMDHGKTPSYSHQVYKVIKCLCPELSISVQAMHVLNSFIDDVMGRISTEAANLVQYSGKSTMGKDDIITATKLVVESTEMYDHAIKLAEFAVEAHQ